MIAKIILIALLFFNFVSNVSKWEDLSDLDKVTYMFSLPAMLILYYFAGIFDF